MKKLYIKKIFLVFMVIAATVALLLFTRMKSVRNSSIVINNNLVDTFSEEEKYALLEQAILQEEVLNGKISPIPKEFKKIGNGYVIIVDTKRKEEFCPGFIFDDKLEYTGMFRWHGSSIDESMVELAITKMN